jgi:hypothetical protein
LSLPVYLFYARSEPVIALNPVIMIVTLAALFPALEPDVPARRLGLLGAVAGASAYFHAGVKAAAFAALALALAAAFARTCAGRYPWQRLVPGVAAALLGVLIGFGPLLQVTDLGLFISRQRLGHPQLGFDPIHLLKSYGTSLRVFFDQPTTSWFPTRQPLIPSTVLAATFAFGALSGFLALPRRVYWSLLFFVFVLPFSNSAITEQVNGDHRLTPLLPVIGFAIAAGIAVVWRAAARLPRPLSIRTARAASVLLIIAAAVPLPYRFFTEQQARRHELDHPLLWFAIQEIRSTPALRDASTLCVGGGAATTEQMRLLHVIDGWGFYLPGKTMQPALLRPGAAPNELYLSTSCEANPDPGAWAGKLYCSRSEPWVCPSPKTGFADVRIYVDARLATAP